MNDYLLRSYQAEDERPCLAIFDTNTPPFFSPLERDDFQRYLRRQAPTASYLVVEHEGSIIACGGLEVQIHANSVGLVWGMVRRDFHGKGVGRLLTSERLRKARELPEVHRVVIDTSQHTKGFYEKLGFTTVNITADGYEPGLDRYDMILRQD